MVPVSYVIGCWSAKLVKRNLGSSTFKGLQSIVAMPLRAPYLRRINKIPVHHTQWKCVPTRCYASRADDPPWFQQLRADMLRRDTTSLVESITAQPGHKLSNTLSGFLPEQWCRSPNFKHPVLPIGHYLIWFNPALPSDNLLPDGTDMLHSPGEPWVRRMWAGGSVQLKTDEYFNKKTGFTLNTAVVGAERIKDVQLRGKDADMKIFVTIERRFARLGRLYESHRRAHGDSEKSNNLSVLRHFKQQLRDDLEWGDEIFKDERNLVFFKDRSAAELDALKAGQMAPVRYLDRPYTLFLTYHALTSHSSWQTYLLTQFHPYSNAPVPLLCLDIQCSSNSP